MEKETFDQYMRENGYLCGEMYGGNWSAIMPLMFTHAIIGGSLSTIGVGYDERWCFHNYSDAYNSLIEWRKAEYKGEPIGWHRHPASGRRREDGDPSKEVVRL